MPRPVYIVCSSSNSIDQQTNLVSLFELIEIVLATKDPTALTAPQAVTGPRLTTMRVMVSWMREDADNENVEFESQLACVMPNGDDLFASPVVKFSFTSIFHRLFSQDLPLAFPSLGVFVIESRVRRIGDEEWTHRQQYPFLVQEATPALAVTPSTQGPPSPPV